MRRFTATIDTYTVWGTRGARMAQILYRGQCVQHFDADALGPILSAAKARGFTHFRESASGRVRPLPDDVARYMELRAEGARAAHAEMMRTRYGINLTMGG
jgi:hypothetical protein